MKQGTKINLLLYKEDYSKIEKFFYNLRIFALIYSIVLTVAVVGFYLYNLSLVNKARSLEKEKQSSIVEITAKQADEANLIYASKKIGLIEKYLAQDTNSLRYYNALTSSLSTVATSSAALTSFAIDKSRKTSFSVAFNSTAEILSFFKLAESDAFLKNFDSLNLNKLNLSSDPPFEVGFEGQFKKL